MSGIHVITVETLTCPRKPNPADGEHKEGQEREWPNLWENQPTDGHSPNGKTCISPTTVTLLMASLPSWRPWQLWNTKGEESCLFVLYVSIHCFRISYGHPHHKYTFYALITSNIVITLCSLIKHVSLVTSFKYRWHSNKPIHLWNVRKVCFKSRCFTFAKKCDKKPSNLKKVSCLKISLGYS